MLKPFLAIALAVAWTATAQAGVLERVRDSGTFNIGFREDAQPFAFKNDIGEPAGYSVELCRAVATQVKKVTGVETLNVNYVPVTADNRFDMLSSGKIDILCGATSQTLSRRETMDFSIPTFIDGASVMFRKDGPQSFQELAGMKVGVRSGTTTQESLSGALAAANIEADVVPVASHQDGLAGLQDGSLDAYFADRAILVFLLLDHGTGTDMMLSERHFTYEPYGLAMQRGESDFRLLVDATLSSIYRSGAVTQLFQASFGAKAQPSEILKAMYVISALPN
jgi:ABC-type amino acid transport substrate-binding protein